MLNDGAEIIIPAEDPESTCDHGLLFNYEEACKIVNDLNLTPYEVTAEIRKRWPRLDGMCPKGCGYCGIAYASEQHYLMGDW